MRLFMIIASMMYGVVIAILAVADSDGLGIVAIVGGVLLGIGWVTLAALSRRGATRP